ncbi:MAG: hypothetical protein VB040_00805, partial [Propionibacterium sp.]|nr:hypothetical protein [Propionibacterium sp.]
MTGNTPGLHDHEHDGAHHEHSHDLWPDGYWEQPPRLGHGLEGHGAVDDFNIGRKPGPIFVNRRGEGGFSGIQT